MELVEKPMVCNKLKQLIQISAGGTLSRLEIIRIACQSCRKLEVCPAISLEEFDFMESKSANRKLDSVSKIQ